MKGRSILAVAPNPSLQRDLAGLLRQFGYEPLLATSFDEAIAALERDAFLMTIVDADPDGGSAFLQRLDSQSGDPGPIIMLCNGTDFHRAVKSGTSRLVDEFVPKPFVPEDLENAIGAVLSRHRPTWTRADEDPVARLRQEIGLWRSPKMRNVWEIIQEAARIDVTVLICGETGTGKDVVARAIHHLSPRQRQPFVKVNCAAVPRELLESELFGHERGAFTSAHQLKIGKFESANHGTIFLDEIGDLHPTLQGKLLHVLQDGTFSRVGGKSELKVDVRVLAATNQDLERAVVEDRFRDDLYYRLNVIRIVVPPLRERAEEIPGLIDYFVQRYSNVFRRPGFSPDRTALERLRQHSYPGNVRELENMVKRMIVLDDPFLVKSFAPVSPPDHADGSVHQGMPEAPLSLKEIARSAARTAEREAIARALEETAWNRTRAAKLLKISYRALLYKIKDVGLDRRGAGVGPV